MSHGYGLGNGRLGGRGGAKAFTPLSLSGLVAWYRADLGVTGSPVSAWADQSGTGDANKNLVQATGTKQPTLNASDAAYNNQATLSFASASTQQLVSGIWSAALTSPKTILFIGNFSGAAVLQYALDGLAVNTAAISNNAAAVNIVINSGAGLSSVVANNGVPQAIVGVYQVAGAIYDNAKTAIASGSAGTSSSTGLTVGSAGNLGAPLNGKIAEIAAWSRALSAAEVAQLLAYAGSRYSIAIGA